VALTSRNAKWNGMDVFESIASPPVLIPIDARNTKVEKEEEQEES